MTGFAINLLGQPLSLHSEPLNNSHTLRFTLYMTFLYLMKLINRDDVCKLACHMPSILIIMEIYEEYTLTILGQTLYSLLCARCMLCGGVFCLFPVLRIVNKTST